MFIRTPNLLLRPGWVEDAPALTAAFAREDVVTMLANAPWPYALDDAVAYLGRDRRDPETDLLIFLRSESPPRLIGGISLAQREDRPGCGDVELGYWIVPSLWGRGYATEAGRAVIAAARDSLRIGRLVAGHFVGNTASSRVLEKLGFVRSGQPGTRQCRARSAMLPYVSYALDLHPMALAA